MLFGVTITPTMMLAGGVTLFALIGFQVLQGKRKIVFKGALHMKVHRRVAWLILLFATLHGIAALGYFGYVRF